MKRRFMINPKLSKEQDGRYWMIGATESYAITSKDNGETWKDETNVALLNIRSACISSNGKYILIGTISNNFAKVSSDFGVTYKIVHLSDMIPGFYYVYMSVDGKYQIISDFYSYVSRDFGETFTELLSPRGEHAHIDILHLSKDGSYLMVKIDGKIFVSRDAGATYDTELIGMQTHLLVIAMSEDCRYIITASGSGEKLFRSADYGATWTELANYGNFDWNAGGMSVDGKYCTIGSTGGPTLVSNDFGVTYTAITSLGSNPSLAGISYNGKYQVVHSFYHIWNSFDYGVTWKSIGYNGNYSHPVMSYAGRFQIATRDSDIIRSSDFGNTWSVVKSNSSKKWSSISTNKL